MMDFCFLMVVSPKDSPLKLQRCLNSLLGQTVGVKEIQVVINGSLPLPLENVLNTFKDNNSFKTILSPNTLSFGLALNLGMQNVSTEWVLRIDPDDISLRERVELARKSVVHEYFDLAFFSNYEIGVVGDVIFKRSLPETFSPQKFMTFNPVVHSTSLIRKSTFVEVGGYRDIHLAEDYDLWLRYILTNKIIKFFPEITLIYDTEGFSKRRRSLKTIEGEIRLMLIKNRISPSRIIVNFLIFLLRVIYRTAPNFLIVFYYMNFISKGEKVIDPEQKLIVSQYL